MEAIFPIMTSSNGNIFRVTGPLCGEFTGHRWIPCTNASDAELWCFLWFAHWINGWVNNREAGDWRRYRTHYDVIVILYPSRGIDIHFGALTDHGNRTVVLCVQFKNHWTFIKLLWVNDFFRGIAYHRKHCASYLTYIVCILIMALF